MELVYVYMSTAKIASLSSEKFEFAQSSVPVTKDCQCEHSVIVFHAANLNEEDCFVVLLLAMTGRRTFRRST